MTQVTSEIATVESQPLASLEIVKKVNAQWKEIHRVAMTEGVDEIGDVHGLIEGEDTGKPYKLDMVKDDSGNHAELYRRKPLLKRLGGAFELVASNSAVQRDFGYIDESAEPDDEYEGHRFIEYWENEKTLYTNNGTVALRVIEVKPTPKADQPQDLIRAIHKVIVITNFNKKGQRETEILIDSQTGEQIGATVNHSIAEQRAILAQFGISL